MTLEEAIRMEETIVKDNERYVNLTRSNFAMPGTDKRKKEEKRVGECEEVIEEHRQLAEWLKELKAIRESQKWIPVSERLPEENIHVLCHFYMGGMAECYHAHGMWHIVGGIRISCDEVVAWMPLPEPYKEVR